jgi:hypothetical protein
MRAIVLFVSLVVRVVAVAGSIFFVKEYSFSAGKPDYVLFISFAGPVPLGRGDEVVGTLYQIQAKIGGDYEIPTGSSFRAELNPLRGPRILVIPSTSNRLIEPGSTLEGDPAGTYVAL